MKNKLLEWQQVSDQVLSKRISKNDADIEEFQVELSKRNELAKTFDSLTDLPKITKESIAGEYTIVGTNNTEDNCCYSGVLTLSFEENQVLANWIIEGKDIHQGYGFVINNLLCLNFCYVLNEKEYQGVVCYEFLSENIISGMWTEAINDMIGLELGRKFSSKTVESSNFFVLNETK